MPGADHRQHAGGPSENRHVVELVVVFIKIEIISAKGEFISIEPEGDLNNPGACVERTSDPPDGHTAFVELGDCPCPRGGAEPKLATAGNVRALELGRGFTKNLVDDPQMVATGHRYTSGRQGRQCRASSK